MAPPSFITKGNADLNADRIISVVGTRKKRLWQSGLRILPGRPAGSGILVVSGLAFGIDTIAHKAALRHGLSTVATLATGSTGIYPFRTATWQGTCWNKADY